MPVAPHALGALDAVMMIEAGSLTAEALTLSCLDRIAEREDAVGAWEWIDRDGALAAAHALDRGPRKGLLHGLPVAVKDTVDVAGMPTRMGSPIYVKAAPAAIDAASVALMRARGGVMLGKTVTTEFANFHPGKTRNPLNPEHTPGGSSSGSAAAVADRMVPLALGTQTAGSVLRPAAFCGVVGYKPSFGLIPRAGAKALADSLDTIGSLARDVPDAALLAAAMAGDDRLAIGRDKPDQPPTIGFCRTSEWRHAQPATAAAFEAVRRAATKAGALVKDIELPPEFQRLAEAQATIQAVETARSLATERLTHPRLLSDRLRKQIDEAGRIPLARYADAVTLVGRCRTMLAGVLHGADVAVAPTAPGAAPQGLSSTGDPVFNRIWTALHGPAIHVPGLSDGAGLPLGVTVAGRFGDDRRVLLAAHWLFLTLHP
ncbi:MAG TPA: amidase [Candidatus Omnitrophota bacterium]|nr:amidase [Candidatus Omnitrophota bacterium]